MNGRGAFRILKYLISRKWLLPSKKSEFLIGPFTEEIGFEVLYWIPFLHKLFEARPNCDLIIFSRGGVSSWYKDLPNKTLKYIDVYDFISPEEFRIKKLARKQHKLTEIDRLDKELVIRSGVPRTVIHPSLMYLGLMDWFSGNISELELDSILNFEFVQPRPTGNLSLTKRNINIRSRKYICLKLYNGPALTIDRRESEFFTTLLNWLDSIGIDVVNLELGIALDDHSYPNFLNQRQALLNIEIKKNLDVQTKLIKSSLGVISSYGGFAHLAAMLGVPSIAFSNQWTSIFSLHNKIHIRQALKSHSDFHLFEFSQILDNDIEILNNTKSVLNSWVKSQQ